MKTVRKGQDLRVLFQKLGNSWYAFAESKEEIIYTKLDENIDPAVTPLEIFEILEEDCSTHVQQKEILT